jgi:uncharacterized OB-fold protein
MSNDTTQQQEPVFVDATWQVRQVYRIDPLLDRFFDALREGRLLGGRVTSTGRVTVPPRSYCDVTGEPVEQLEPVGPGGVVRAITQVMTPFPNAPKPPYLIVFVQLDGASNACQGYLRGVDATAPPSLDWVGRRCKAVFAAERTGGWSDFWFEPES